MNLSAAEPPTPDPAPERADLGRALQGRALALRLPDGLEAAFRRDGLAARLRYTERALIAGLLLFNGFLVVDWFMVGDAFGWSVLIRLGFCTPAGLILLASCRALAPWVQRRGAHWFPDLLGLLSGWGSALSLVIIALLSSSPTSVYYPAGFVVILVCCTLIYQLSFPWAVCFTGGVLVLHAVTLHFEPAVPPALRQSLTHMVFTTAVFTLVADYLVERAARRRYLLLRRDRLMVGDLQAINASLQRLSRSDALTGIGNRRHTDETLETALAEARQTHEPVSVMLLDVDHFKAYNDHYGHPAGDQCLQQVARVLKEALQGSHGTVGRMGGEEFLAVLPGSDAATALHMAQRVRRALESAALPHAASTTAPVVTASLGVATAWPAHERVHGADLLLAADRALYMAKQRGRNRVATSPASSAQPPLAAGQDPRC